MNQQYLDLFNSLDNGQRNRNDCVVIVDGLNTFIRVFSVVPSLNDDGEHIGGITGFLKSIGYLIRQFNATRCIIVFDGEGGSLRRRRIYSEYKNNRKPSNYNRLDDFGSDEDLEQSMRRQIRRIGDYLSIMPVDVIQIDKVEADDVIATLAVDYFQNKSNEIIINSTDKDFIQLINSKIKVWSPTKKLLYDEDNLKKVFKVSKGNYLLYRVLTGDKSDNIDGVKGLGLKTLIKRFPGIVTEPYTIDRLLNECKQYIDNGEKYKIYTQILEAEKIIRRNYELMQLNTSIINGSILLKIYEKLDNSTPELDTVQFKRMFLQDKLYSDIRDIDTWLRNSLNRLLIYGK